MLTPKKHHFLPVFYLKQWARNSGTIVEFSIPYKNIVKPKRVDPHGTGYVPNLYSSEKSNYGLDAWLESEYLSPLDSRAAEALDIIMKGGHLNYDNRIAWASFIATLLLRMPDDINYMKECVSEIAAIIGPEFREVYNRYAGKDESKSFDDVLKEVQENSRSKSIDYIKTAMSKDDLIRSISGMKWWLLRLDRSTHPLLTSDRPVIYTNVLGDDASHIILPVAPRRLFVAYRNEIFLGNIKKLGESKLAKLINVSITQGASQYVYGQDDSQLIFIQRKMGTKRKEHLAERLLKSQRENYSLVIEYLKSQIVSNI